VTAVAAHSDTTIHTHFDERGTAFMALGYGKATGRPAVWITSSGTALANGYPAIVEASMEGIPMLLLTADRPPELRDSDANQTIQQQAIFGSYVEWFVDVPTPTDEIPPEYLLTMVDQALERSRAGVVHLNCMFREPLAPDQEDYSPLLSNNFKQWKDSKHPYTSYRHDLQPTTSIVDELASQLSKAKRPLIVLGRLRTSDSSVLNRLQKCCKAYDAVFIPDIGSGVRLATLGELGIGHAEATLYGDLPEALRPDLVMQFGASPVSKRVNALMQSATYVVVDDRNRKIDPGCTVSLRVVADPVAVLTALSVDRTEEARPEDFHGQSEWQGDWKRAIDASSKWADTDLGTALTEQTTAHTLSRCLSSDLVLAVASSNPVRHLDLCAITDGKYVPVVSNRGASGIDGTIATASGFGDGHKRRPVVLIGDLALLHDLNSLALCRERGTIVVVINNDGGGIFSYLPIRDYPEVFEQYFATPHGLSFKHAALQFGMSYSQPASIGELTESLNTAFSQSGAAIIEVRTDRGENLEEQRRILRAMSSRLDSVFRAVE